MNCIIYGLVDPVSGDLRYVGKSVQGMARPKKHFYPSVLRNERTRKNNWVKSVLNRTGELPKIIVLEEVDSEESLNIREIKFIALARSLGFKLTNTHDGGNGMSSKQAKAMRKLVKKEDMSKGGKAAANSGVCARNNLKLRKPIVATNIATGEERWYLSACHAAADNLGSRSAISNSLREGWRCQHNRGWRFQFIKNFTNS